MPGWSVFVYISGVGQAYHRTPFCPWLKAGQEKAAERGQVVRRIVCVPMVEAKGDGRRPCRGCCVTSGPKQFPQPGPRPATAP